MAKKTKITKNAILTHGFVENSFKAEAPKIKVARQANATKITTMESPYVNAFAIPSLLDLLCLVNKLTVKGIIGKMHGITNANNPPPTPRMKISQSDLSFFLSPEFDSFSIEVVA